ncbi:MAG: peptidylprolyl isomerase [Candidatus Krumholzibacteriia bacterium]
MFKLLRSKAKFFYWIIAASFILFIFLAWGADFQGRRQGGGGRQGDLVGEVNGAPITRQEWDQALQNYLSRMRQQNQDQALSPNDRAVASEKLWQGLVRDRLERQEIKHLGLSVSDQEILDVLRTDPPPELLSQFRDDKGQPDMAAYMAELNNPNRDWSGVEAYLRESLPRQKLQQMIASRAVVSDAEVHDAWLRQQGRAVAEWMGVLTADLPPPPEPTEQEIATLYQETRGRYELPARVKLTYVSWPKVPSEGDKAEVRQLALDVKREIESGQSTFAEAAAIYSADPSKDRGGDLGTFDRNQMAAPFTAVAFTLPPGQISDPVETPFGYHLIEVLEQVRENGQVVRVHARHILFKVEAGDATLSALADRADQFITQAREEGFDKAVAAAGLKPQTPAPVAADQDIPGLPGSVAGTQFAFQAKPGQVSDLLENDDVYFVVRCDRLLPAGPAPLDEVRSQVVAEARQRRLREVAAQKLAPAVAAVRAGASLADAATRFGLTYAVTDTFTAAGNVAKVGFGTAFNLAAIETPPGRLVPQVETPRGVFALRTLWRSPLTEAAFAQQQAQVRAQLLGRRQYEMLDAWYQQRIAAAKIVDHRSAQARTGG